MKAEKLHLIQEGDEIKFTSVSHVHGIHDTVGTATVIGMREAAALIKRDTLTIAVQPHRIIAVLRDSESIYAEGETMSEEKEPYETEEPFEEHLPDPLFEQTGDYSEFAKQTKMEFPHFQEREGKKVVTLFSLELTNDMRHTIGVQFADLKTSLNAHDARKLLEWLHSHRSEITALSQQLDAAARSDDMADMRRIDREWHAYRNEGLGTSG